MLSFCKGLLDQSEDEEDGEDHSTLIDKYWI
jgi:hypothetical protein